MFSRRKLHEERNESEQICDTNSDEYAENTESAKDEDDYNASPTQHQQVMKSGLWSQANHTHTHVRQVTSGDTARSRMKHCT
jgi:hypothetical protein